MNPVAAMDCIIGESPARAKPRYLIGKVRS